MSSRSSVDRVPGVQEIMGSILVGYSDFFFTHVMFINSPFHIVN